MKRTLVFFVALSLFFLGGCRHPLGVERARERVAEGVSLPTGVWYRYEAKAWESECLPAALFPVFFGKERPDYPWVLYLGTDDDTFAELLYAVCHTEYEAEMLSISLLTRLASVRRNAEGRFAESLDDASVSREGKSVLYTAVPENQAVRDLFH